MKGWFPRRCVKLPDSYYSNDSGNKQASSDTKNSKQETSENHEDVVKAKPPSASVALKSKGAAGDSQEKKPKVTQSTSEGDGASGTTPTSGARKRAKKSKTDKKKGTNA